MKLTVMSNEVYTYVTETGGHIAVSELVEALGRGARSISASINDLAKKGLCVREKVAGEGEGAKEITYVNLTEAGKTFVPSED